MDCYYESEKGRVSAFWWKIISERRPRSRKVFRCLFGKWRSCFSGDEVNGGTVSTFWKRGDVCVLTDGERREKVWRDDLQERGGNVVCCLEGREGAECGMELSVEL